MKQPDVIEKLNSFNIDELISMGVNIQEQIQELYKNLNYIKWLVYEHLRQQDAKKYPSDIFEAEIEYKSGGYIYNKLYLLLELLPEDEKPKVHTPAEEKMVTVPPKWDGRVLRRLKGYGGEIKRIIEEAELPDEVTGIVLKRKNIKNNY